MLHSAIVSQESSRRKMSDIPSRLLSTNSNDSDSHNGSDKPGKWMRRRRIDGALNRVPENFYQYVWRVLERVSTGYFVSANSRTILKMNISITYDWIIVSWYFHWRIYTTSISYCSRGKDNLSRFDVNLCL